MLVKELIAQLGMEDPEAQVHFCYNYGDHWRTMVAPEVDEVEEGLVMHSSYHDKYVVADEEDEEKGKDVRTVVLLRA